MCVVSFGLGTKNITVPIFVSTLFCESTISKRFYKNCIVTIFYSDTIVDLVQLDRQDFNIILEMD